MHPEARIPAAAGAAIALVSGLLAGCATAGEGLDAVAGGEGLPLALPAGVEVRADLVYGEAGGVPLLLDACVPSDAASAQPGPAVLIVHGGSWARGDKGGAYRDLCVHLADRGYNAFSVNYRLAPEWTYPAQVDDVARAMTWLREPAQLAEFGIDPARIGAIGASAGGTLAASIGMAGEGSWAEGSRIAAVVELSGPIDLSGVAETDRLTAARLDYLGCEQGADCPAAAAASPHLAVDPTDPPTLIVHATDEFVPFEQAEIFRDALENAGVRVDLVEIEGDEHAMQLLDDEVRQRIVSFLDSTIGGQPVVASGDEAPTT